MRPNHTTDADCTVDPETLCCSGCGVYHGDEPCAYCDGRGFHAAGCRESDATTEEVLAAVARTSDRDIETAATRQADGYRDALVRKGWSASAAEGHWLVRKLRRVAATRR